SGVQPPDHPPLAYRRHPQITARPQTGGRIAPPGDAVAGAAAPGVSHPTDPPFPKGAAPRGAPGTDAAQCVMHVDLPIYRQYSYQKVASPAAGATSPWWVNLCPNRCALDFALRLLFPSPAGFHYNEGVMQVLLEPAADTENPPPAVPSIAQL